MTKLFVALLFCAGLYGQGTGVPGPQRTFKNPVTIPCTVGSSQALLYNNAGVDAIYTAQGSPCVYSLNPSGSITTLTPDGVGAGGLATANKLTGPANSIITTDGSGDGSVLPAVNGDGTLSPTSGALSISKIGGVLPGPYFATPTVTGDGTLNGTSGALSVTKLNGVLPGALFSQDNPTSGQIATGLGYTAQNAATANTNNAGIGVCSSGLYGTGTASGGTQPCAQVQAAQVNGLGTIATLSATNTPLLGTPTIAGNPVTYAATPVATGDATFDVSSGVVAVSKVAGVAPGTLYSQSPSASTEPQALPGGTVSPYSYLNPNVSSPVAQTQTQINAKIIRVSDFGVLNDNVDHTTAMNALMANAPAGSLIEFPCATNGNYRFAGQLVFTANHIYRGDSTRASAGAGCPILSTYGGGAGSGAAFNFLGASSFRLEHLHFVSSNSSTPPEAAAMFGDISGSPGDNITAIDVIINGWATRTLVYSIAAEGQRWIVPDFELSGGGALYIWYTSDADTLGICPAATPCTGGSNTDNRFSTIQFVDQTSSPAAGHCAVAVAGGSGTKDVSFEFGYIPMPGNISGTANGSAFCFPSNIGGNILVSSIRSEGAANFASATANISNLHLTFNTKATITGETNFFNASAGTTMTGLTEFGNTSTVGSSIASLTNSFVFEPFAVTVTAPFQSLVNTSSGIFQLSAIPQLNLTATSRPTCAAAQRGSFYSAQTVLPYTLEYCAQDQGGTFAWRDLLTTLINPVASSATPAFDLSKGQYQTNTLTAPVTSSTATNLAAGSQSYFKLTENSTGGFTYVWPTNIKGVGPINTAANAINVVGASCFDTSNCYATGPVMDSAGNGYFAGTVSSAGNLIQPNLSGTTSSIGGGALLAGACTSGTVAVTGSTTAMAVSASPVTYPGDGNYWLAYVSTAGTVTVKVCGAVAGTPTASAYNVRVIQ